MADNTTMHAWDGADGERWAAEAERYDRMSRRFAQLILDTAAPQPGEQVLDVGCGNGAVTLSIARLVDPGGTATGLDISSPMLSVARQRAEAAAVANVDFVRADAQTAELAGYDLIVSRFGVMFFDDPQAAFTNLARGLKPGGRMVFTCWRELLANDWVMIPAAIALEHVPMPELGEPGGPGPFSLADEAQLQTLLERAGFDDVRIERHELPLTLGSDVPDALSFMRHGEMAEILFTGVDTELVERAWEAIDQRLQEAKTADGVELNGSVWLVTATRSAT